LVAAYAWAFHSVIERRATGCSSSVSERILTMPPASIVAPFQVDVTPRVIGGVECDTVNGRELHTKLGNKDHFATWIKDRTEQLNFIENQHFEKFSGISEKRGRPPVEYRLTLVAAKKIAMAEHTEMGDKARDYFIEREKMSYELQAKQAAPASDDRITELLGAVSAMTNTM
jgi:phage anti-repressor protein